MNMSPSEEPNNSTKSDSVRVSVRVRPLNSREKAAATESKTSWKVDASSVTQVIADKPIPANSFAFDHVFQPHINNEQVYCAIAQPVVTSAAEGVNGVIFAYGQTAAGKTYTMLGTEQDPGITRRSITAIFDLISNTKNRQFLLRASYIEIYNEIIRDLLVPDNDNLKIHEDVINKRVFVDSREEVVTSVQQVMDIIARGENVRAVGETNMNDRSSRSHTIFSLKIESREMSPAEVQGEESASTDDGVAVRASTLSLVDLAGSERASFTKAQGMRLVEGGHINKSLLTLGTVINKLSSGEQGTSAHIPYRDSKLTRLLQPALGGNARTAIVCAITPAVLHMEETMSTLKFASRAKKVTNNAKTNEFLDDRAKLRRAEKEIAQLKKECQQLRENGSAPLAQESCSQKRVSPESSQQRIGAFEKKFEKLLHNVNKNMSPLRDATKKRKRKYSEMMQPTIMDALNLFCSKSAEANGLLEQCDASSDTIAADLRKKLLSAEKQMRQEQTAINYERQAMVAEVDALLISTEQADKARLAAEHECSDARFKLGRAQVASLVDEIVSNAMCTSLATQDLRRTRARVSQLEHVDGTNKDLKEKLCVLQKDHDEVVKREKRGVGPVMREMKLLQGKLADAEQRCKTFRERSAKAAAEKTAVDRELKNIERQNRALHGEVEKHRAHEAKAQSRMNKQFTEEKEKLESEKKLLSEEVSKLTSQLNDNEKALTEANTSVKELKKEVEGHTAKETELKQKNGELEQAKKELESRITSSDKLCQELKEKVSKLESTGAAQRDELGALTEELEKAQLEAEEKGVQLSNAEKRADEAEKEKSKLYDDHKEAEKQLLETVRGREELEELLKKEKSCREEALQELVRVQHEMHEQQSKINELEEALANMRKDAEQTEAKHEEKSKQLEEALHKHDETEQGLKESVRVGEVECGRLRDELEALRNNLRSECASKEKAVEAERNAKEEMRKVEEEVEKLVEEVAVRSREVLKLSEALQLRDRRVYGLEDALDVVRRGEGAVAALEKRVRRRDVVIKDMTKRVDLQTEALKKKFDMETFVKVDRVVQMEANYAAVVEERMQHEQLVKRYERERRGMIEENRKLREKIKEKDLKMVREAVKRKETKVEEVKRNKEALQQIDVNTLRNE